MNKHFPSPVQQKGKVMAMPSTHETTDLWVTWSDGDQVALEKLTSLVYQECQVIELRFFGGLSIEETAEALKVSPGMVRRDWSLA